MLLGNYTGCQISICDGKGELIAKTSVIDCDYVHSSIVIRGRYAKVRGIYPVDVLIFTGGGVHEYHGRIRNSVVDALASEITLFEGKETENRAAKRYHLDSKAVAREMVFHTTVLPLLHPIEVVVANMSSTGALLKGPQGCFAVGNILLIDMAVGISDVEMRGEIVRENICDSGSAEYGCRFVFETRHQADPEGSGQPVPGSDGGQAYE